MVWTQGQTKYEIANMYTNHYKQQPVNSSSQTRFTKPLVKLLNNTHPNGMLVLTDCFNTWDFKIHNQPQTSSMITVLKICSLKLGLPEVWAQSLPQSSCRRLVQTGSSKGQVSKTCWPRQYPTRTGACSTSLSVETEASRALFPP